MVAHLAMVADTATATNRARPLRTVLRIHTFPLRYVQEVYIQNLELHTSSILDFPIVGRGIAARYRGDGY